MKFVHEYRENEFWVQSKSQPSVQFVTQAEADAWVLGVVDYIGGDLGLHRMRQVPTYVHEYLGRKRWKLSHDQPEIEIESDREAEIWLAGYFSAAGVNAKRRMRKIEP